MGALLFRFLPQVRPLPRRTCKPRSFPGQARLQEPVRGPTKPSFRCCRAAFPISPGSGCQTRFACGDLHYPSARAAQLPIACPVWRRQHCAAAGDGSPPGGTAHAEAGPAGECGPRDTAGVAATGMHAAPERARSAAARNRLAGRPGRETFGARTRRFLGTRIPRPRGGNFPPQLLPQDPRGVRP